MTRRRKVGGLLLGLALALLALHQLRLTARTVRLGSFEEIVARSEARRRTELHDRTSGLVRSRTRGAGLADGAPIQAWIDAQGLREKLPWDGCLPGGQDLGDARWSTTWKRVVDASELGPDWEPGRAIVERVAIEPELAVAAALTGRSELVETAFPALPDDAIARHAPELVAAIEETLDPCAWVPVYARLARAAGSGLPEPWLRHLQQVSRRPDPAAFSSPRDAHHHQLRRFGAMVPLAMHGVEPVEPLRPDETEWLASDLLNDLAPAFREEEVMAAVGFGLGTLGGKADSTLLRLLAKRGGIRPIALATPDPAIPLVVKFARRGTLGALLESAASPPTPGRAPRAGVIPAAEDDAARARVFAVLAQVAGKDLGPDPAAWRGWLDQAFPPGAVH